MNFILRHRKATLLAVILAMYLRFLLPATATAFYELYHLTGIDALYHGYSLFKGAGYYFGVWTYRDATCMGAALAILALAGIGDILRHSSGSSNEAA